MNPSLLYGQAIQGRYKGRSIGIIDTLHLAEVARSAKFFVHHLHFQPVSSRCQAMVSNLFDVD